MKRLGGADHPALLAFGDRVPAFDVTRARYRARFAAGVDDVRRVQRLRYEVFNRELGEGLAESEVTGLDQDLFDDQCHHLLVECPGEDRVVGTYRVQTAAMAASASGFYSAGEFDLSPWPDDVVSRSAELGRAAIAREHRHGNVLQLLWQGLGAYAIHNGMRYLFGCCSITSQDPAEAARVLELLRREGHLHPTLGAEPRPACDAREYDESTEGWEATRLPILFRTYLRYGARVCGRPAIDRDFGTIDYLAIADLQTLDPATILRRFDLDLSGAS